MVVLIVVVVVMVAVILMVKLVLMVPTPGEVVLVLGSAASLSLTNHKLQCKTLVTND